MSNLLIQKKKVPSEDTIQEVKACYGGEKWIKEMNELFPSTKRGCINFGYWESVPDVIPVALREKSQIDLYNKVLEFSGLDKKPGSVLEVGCGRGHGVNLLAAKGYDAYGVDLVDSQIEKCITNYPSLKSKFKKGFSNKTGFRADFFDYVVSVEAAQHFHNFLSFARECYRILKKDGTIAITTFFFPKKSCRKEIKEIIPDDISGTHRTIQIQQAEVFLKKAGFRNIKSLSIGSKVFDGFCKWATQAMSQKNHTPKWIEAYEAKLLDYYIIRGDKE